MSPVLKVWCRTVDILLRFLRGVHFGQVKNVLFKKSNFFCLGGGASDCSADHQKLNVI